jgi:hypothetical protein
MQAPMLRLSPPASAKGDDAHFEGFFGSAECFPTGAEGLPGVAGLGFDFGSMVFSPDKSRQNSAT